MGLVSLREKLEKMKLILPINESPDFKQKKNMSPSAKKKWSKTHVSKGKYEGMLRTEYEKMLRGDGKKKKDAISSHNGKKFDNLKIDTNNLDDVSKKIMSKSGIKNKVENFEFDMIKDGNGKSIKNVKKMAGYNNIYRGVIDNYRIFYDNDGNFLGARIKNNDKNSKDYTYNKDVMKEYDKAAK